MWLLIFAVHLLMGLVKNWKTTRVFVAFGANWKIL
jgi:hypothetical protein